MANRLLRPSRAIVGPGEPDAKYYWILPFGQVRMPRFWARLTGLADVRILL